MDHKLASLDAALAVEDYPILDTAAPSRLDWYHSYWLTHRQTALAAPLQQIGWAAD
ncbi:Uncharacterised protein [Vibrio cholerae]|uniref:Uncharacterized protein n=1 Tax=Vibrio cholerae TaxID=666 RepID=A0A655X899_VIBCL|nr:Uncharacterised protein [Vibrio cholerae]CSC06322.1 Uncharacterised protein [Vibrio cholerae]